MHRLLQCTLLASLALAIGAPSASADPCGMVPPLQIAGPKAARIERVGAQKTFVTHKNGMMTMVLRPGFKGNVEEFGMLIPFPSPPALRKVDDNIFGHIAAAVDPPEITAWVRRFRARRSEAMSALGAGSTRSKSASVGGLLKYDEVKVVNREAVGMYDVAVLAAGSAKALKRWMDSHGFRYPEGMDDVTQDYVKDGWVFVAVKTKVGQKAGVNPRPGMRTTNSKRPAGSTFKGHVQAMGFRYRSNELVVPMRLAAFNEGKPRNVVYILSERPESIRDIPKRFVRRQVSGKQLYRNLTRPLPVRVFGGTLSQLTPMDRQRLRSQRNQKPHNGLAAELFAADMLAMSKGHLANDFEEEEKRLLAISEELGLRGRRIDNLHRGELKLAKKRAVKDSLSAIKSMHMTVIDGEFDRNVLKRDNLRFAYYRMNKRKNNRRSYDSRTLGPNRSTGGKVYYGALPAIPKREKESRPWIAGGVGLAMTLLLGLVWRRRRSLPWIAPALVLAGSLASATAASAADHQLPDLVAGLDDEARHQQLMRELRGRGDHSVGVLREALVTKQGTTVARGRMLIVLADIGTEETKDLLEDLSGSRTQPRLIRTWAAASRFRAAQSFAELRSVSRLARNHRSLRRSFRKRAEVLSSSATDVEQVLALAQRRSDLRAGLLAGAGSHSADKLVRTMLRGKTTWIRRTSAQLLASKAPAAAVSSFIDLVAFEPGRTTVPWKGGPLYLPPMADQGAARAVGTILLSWHVWADERRDRRTQKVLRNNLIALSKTAGVDFGKARRTQDLLAAWADQVSEFQVRFLLWQQRRPAPESGRLEVDTGRFAQPPR